MENLGNNNGQETRSAGRWKVKREFSDKMTKAVSGGCCLVVIMLLSGYLAGAQGVPAQGGGMNGAAGSGASADSALPAAGTPAWNASRAAAGGAAPPAAGSDSPSGKTAVVKLGNPSEFENQEQNEKRVRINNLERQAKRYFQNQRYEDVRRTINELIELNPYRPDYHFAYALMLRRQGQLEECFKKLKDVLELHGPEQLVYLLMAEYHEKQKDRAKTLSYLRKAAESGMKIMQMVGKLDSMKHLQNDTEFIKLALMLEKFELRSLKYNNEYFRSHLDPFTPSSKWINKPKPVPGENEQPNLNGEKFFTHSEETELFLNAKKAVNSLMMFLNAPVPDEEKIAQKYEELKQILKKKDGVRIPKLKREFDVIVEKVKEIETRIENVRLRIYYNKTEKKIAEIKEAFEEAQYVKVQTLNSEVKEITKNMKKESQSFAPLAESVEKIAESWQKRSAVRMEFKEKDLRIRGIITSTLPSGDGGDNQEVDFVIINNKLKQEGSEYDDFEIRKIERNRVTFLYKGEEIGMIFRRY